MTGTFVDFEAARILVADDDPILREFACVHLATPSVEIELAADGVEALERLRQGDIDLVLVDLEMPRMDGYELIRVIRSDEVLCHMPVVVVTGREDIIAVDRAYAAGATSFVTKPLNWRVLSHQLAYVLKSARTEAALRSQLDAERQVGAEKTRLLKLAARAGLV